MKKVGLFLFLIGCAENSDNYLDYAASAHLSSEAAAMFLKVANMDGNSSGINPHANRLKHIEEQSAEIIASKINAQADDILFTNSATVSNNIAILGVAKKYPKCHLITSKIEHKSVLNVFYYLESIGHPVTYLDVDRYGNIDFDQLERSITSNTKLISIQSFNSEIGTIQNMQKIGEIAHRHGVLFHSDASQMFCKYPIDVDAMRCDFLTISGYKIGAPKGIAALYIRDQTKLEPILYGSGDNLFPGSKPTALIASFAQAVKAYAFDHNKISANFYTLKREIEKISGVYINSARPSHVFSVSIDGVLLSDVLEAMPDYSFSAGCSCLGQGQSNVMTAIDPDGKLPSCTLRISFSDRTNTDVLISFADKLKTVVTRLRQMKSISGGNCDHQDESQKAKMDSMFNKIIQSISRNKQ